MIRAKCVAPLEGYLRGLRVEARLLGSRETPVIFVELVDDDGPYELANFPDHGGLALTRAIHRALGELIAQADGGKS